MRHGAAVFLWLLAGTPVAAQHAHRTALLDSGTVVRLHWGKEKEKARLLAPLRPESSVVQYCRYPSPACGKATVNPMVTRPLSELTQVDVRRGTRTRRGALIGAAAGVASGLLILLAQAYRDSPALSTGTQVLEVVLVAAAWSGIGALVGAASDNWEPIH